MVDAAERLQVLLTQEATVYRTSDYLTRMHIECHGTTANASQSSALHEDDARSNKKRKSWSNVIEMGADNVSPPQHMTGMVGGTTSERSSSTMINKHWREKICEWAYQGAHRRILNFVLMARLPTHHTRTYKYTHFSVPYSCQKQLLITLICTVRSSALP